MREVPTTEFTRNFGVYREVVQREPIEVTSHGRPTGYFISALDYEQFQHLKAMSRRVRRLHDLSEDEIEQMAATRMSPEHDHLNSLLDE